MGLERFTLTPLTALPQHPSLRRELGLSKTLLKMSRGPEGAGEEGKGKE